MTERMDWKNTLCATDNFRYKLIRYKEKVYAVTGFRTGIRSLQVFLYAFSKRKHIF